MEAFQDPSLKIPHFLWRRHTSPQIDRSVAVHLVTAVTNSEALELNSCLKSSGQIQNCLLV